MSAIEQSLLHFIEDWRNLLGLAALAAVLLVVALYWQQTRFMLRSLRRNPLRSLLTGMATFVLVLVVTLVWSVLGLLDEVTQEKSKNLKAMVTEKYQAPSRLPMHYVGAMSRGAPRQPGDYEVDAAKDSMYWSLYFGQLGAGKAARDEFVVLFALEPRKVMAVDERGHYTTMMEGMDTLPEADKARLAADALKMEKRPDLVLLGAKRLAAIHKRVGERFKLTSFNFIGIDLEFEVLDVLPGADYDQNAVMNFQYLERGIDKYNEGKPKSQWHPQTDQLLALMFLRVPDKPTFERVARQIETSPEFPSPAVKCETLSSGVASFIEPFKDLLFGVRWLLVPAILATISLVIANAISISVRERRTEMAVLKVLGFTPVQLLLLVLSEALLIGGLSGLASGTLAWFVVNHVVGGISLPIMFFNFRIDDAAPWWGLWIGAGAALVGSISPAWSAGSVKVSEVFSKVA